MARVTVMAEIRTGDNLPSELACRNHRNASKYAVDVLAEAAADAVLGRAIVFPVMQTINIWDYGYHRSG